MTFKFNFSGDNSDGDSGTDSIPAPPPASTRSQSAEAPVPARHHALEEMVSFLPRNISYSTLAVSPSIQIPRRELYDIRMQLMAEDELNGTGPERGMIIGLGNEDIRTSLYEGGLKSWECSVDLVRHLATIYDVDKGAQVKKVLELGCGTSLPSSFLFQTALKVRKDDTSKRGGSLGRFTLADYNLEVLRLVTLPNLVLSWAMVKHLPGKSWEPEGDLDVTESLVADFVTDLNALGITLDFVSGKWGDGMLELLRPSCPYDLVLGSETIYSPSTTPLFADVLLGSLGAGGIGVIAAKQIYFGVGGSVTDFIDVVTRKDRRLQARIAWEEKGAGVGRSIIELSRET